jgi:multicomponent K+:H+ antiporter subunit E
MKRWLPAPLLSCLLLLSWLILNQTIALAQIALGLIIAIAIPLLTHRLQALGYPKLRKPLLLLRLLGMALVEIVRSCLVVGWLILSSRRRGLNAQFIRIPLDLRNQYGLALLSCLINSTPGTVWVEILPERYELALHVFDLHDEQWWINTIKTQYEKPLIEIFE